MYLFFVKINTAPKNRSGDFFYTFIHSGDHSTFIEKNKKKTKRVHETTPCVCVCPK